MAMVKPVIIRRIPDGGCHHPDQLKRQLGYINKDAILVLGSGFGKHVEGGLSSLEIRELIDDWSASWKQGYQRRNGQTSHILISFPEYVTDRQAVMIVEEWCYGMFESREITDDTWRYYAALHTDMPNIHFHVILNNKGDDGEWFYLGNDHHFSPHFMRGRMAEIAAGYGVEIDPRLKNFRRENLTSDGGQHG